MEVSVLGPVEVRLEGRAVDLGTPKQRALVAALALSHGWPVSVDAIVDLLWEDAAPPGVTGTLQAYVSQLRRVMEPDRPRRAPATVLVTAAPGYALRVPDDRVDATRFEQAVGAAHRSLQGMTGPGRPELTADRLVEEVARLDSALSLWRGTPYVELGDAPAAVTERGRLEQLRLLALEDRAVAGLALGHHATVAAELEALTAAHPLRERLWALRALALARSGRQADALGVLARVRDVLDEELGLELSPELRELQTAILRQDPSLEWQPPETGVPSGPAAAPPEPQPAPSAAAADRVAPWPMVGRDRELATLTGALSAAAAGTPSYAVITGEPGIGKSRLAAELVVQARRRGTRVLVGRCSQDDGAPPLWPWKAVLEGLGLPLEHDDAGREDEGGQFRAWERIAAAVRGAALQQPTLVLLDDLHWADRSTLRVLRLLADTTDQGRLMVLCTWRPHPEPTGALADVAEALARRHALRIELAGLPAGEVATVFEAVADRPLSGEEADAVRDRTDGNPFFLVELARWSRERHGAVQPGGDELPSAVADVLNRRLTRLPERTVAALRTAAVIGRQFDLPTLAAATGIDEDEVLDVVDPAQAAGLVREHGIDEYLFAHALVRDTLQAGLTASRRARAHRRVAEALAGVPGRETEVAWHWRSAGPSYADRTWRAAVEAARVARRLHDHERVAELLREARAAQEHDPAVTLAERFDVLMALIDAFRWAALLPDLVATVEEAIAVGKAMRDPGAVAQAAISTTQGVLWRSGQPGETHEGVVSALRGSLDRLPPEDSDLRCRTLLALANELGDSVPSAERRPLVDAGLAMARRIGDPSLLMSACQVAQAALWLPPTASERLELDTEAMELARRTGDEQGFVVSATLRTVVLSELGRPAEMFEAADVARAAAQRTRIGFGELILDSLLVPWHAMAGRFDECDRLLAHLHLLGSRLSHYSVEEASVAALLALRLWQGRSIEMVPVLEAFDRSAHPFAASVAVYLWRAGERDRARAYHRQHGAPLEHESDVSLLAWCHAAELSLYLADPELGARCRELLTPYAGRSCCAGSALALGPVDTYLAMASAAAGESERALRHADDALALAEAWELPVLADWIREQRKAYGF